MPRKKGNARRMEKAVKKAGGKVVGYTKSGHIVVEGPTGTRAFGVSHTTDDPRARKNRASEVRKDTGLDIPANEL